MPLYAHDHLIHKLHQSKLFEEFRENFTKLTAIPVGFRKTGSSSGSDVSLSNERVEVLLKVGVVELGYLYAKGPLSKEKAIATKRMLEMAAEHISARLMHPIEGSPKAIPAVILQATEIIRNQYSEPIRLSGLAKELKISQERLSRLFKESLGMNYSEYLNEVRLEHCRHRLKYSKESITEIAFKSGFQSISQFNRRFRNAEGISPRQYRDAHQISEITLEHLLW